MTAKRRFFSLPGAAAFPRYWKPLGERLPESWEKTYFGWPGIGDESPDPSVKGFDDLVRDRVPDILEAVHRHLE